MPLEAVNGFYRFCMLTWNEQCIHGWTTAVYNKQPEIFIYTYIIMDSKWLEKATLWHARATVVYYPFENFLSHREFCTHTKLHNVWCNFIFRKLPISAKECLGSEGAVDCSWAHRRGQLIPLNAASSQCVPARVPSTLILLLC